MTNPKFQHGDRVEVFLGCEYIGGIITYCLHVANDIYVYRVNQDDRQITWHGESLLSPEDEFAAWAKEVRANAAAVD